MPVTTEPQIAFVRAVQARIQSLGLKLSDGTTLATAQVVTAKLPTDREDVLPYTTDTDGTHKPTLPAVICTLVDGAERIEDGDFEQDCIGYPVLVTHVFAGNQGMALDATPMTWRRAIRAAFEEKTLDTEHPQIKAYRCLVEFQKVIDVSLFHDDNLDLGALIVWCYFEEARNKALNEN